MIDPIVRGGAAAVVVVLAVTQPLLASRHFKAPDQSRATLTSFDHSGDRRWSAQLGAFDQRLDVLGVHGGVVIGELDGCDDEPADGVGPPSIVAYDAKTGRVRWRAEDPGGWARTLGSLGTIVTQGYGTGITGLDPRTGQRRWHLPDGVAVAAGGKLLLVRKSSTSGSIVEPGPLELTAFDLRTGRGRWHTSMPDAAQGLVQLDATSIVVTWESTPAGPSVPITVAVLDPATGMERFRQTQPSGTQVVVLGPRLVFDDPGTGLLAVDARSGVERWRLPGTAVAFGVPAPAGDLYARLVGGHDDRAVAKIDALSGSVRWRFGDNDIELVAAGRDLTVFTDRRSSTAVALDARTGSRRWDAELPDATPSGAIDLRSNTFIASGCSLTG